MNAQIKGALFCLFAVVTWGGMFPVMGDALSMMNPFIFTAIRYIFVSAILALALLHKEGVSAFRVEGRGWALWALGSAGFAGFGFLVFLGQEMAGTAGVVVAAVMMALMPMISVLISWAVLGKRPVRHSLFFVALSLIGVVLVVTKGEFGALLNLYECLLAAAVILLGALCWVIYTVGATTRPEWSTLRYTSVTSLLGLPTIVAVNLGLTVAGMNPMPCVADVVNLFPHITYMVVVTGILGVLAWNAGNRILNPVNGVLFMNVVPVTAGITAAALGYPLSGAEIFGAFLTIISLVLHSMNQRRGGVWRQPKWDDCRATG